MSFNPFPEKFGAAKGTDLESLLDTLKDSVGSAFNTESTTVNWIYLNAIARVFNDVFGQNKRLANQWDPDRMTDFLPRWEKILGISPLATDTLIERRAKVKVKLQTFGKSGTYQVVTDLLNDVLGSDVFVDITHNDSNSANVWVAGGAVIPGGATIPDGTPIGIPWYSTVSYLPIKVIKPSYMDDETFYVTVNQIFLYLGSLLPAWVTYDWYRESETLGAGFILDDEWNLDNQAFDV